MPEPASAAAPSLTIRVCQQEERDARLIMEWRNDPRTLAAFFHREPKQWSTFWLEYQDRYFSHADLPPHFVCLDGAPIAFLRYVPDEPAQTGRRSVDVSINLAARIPRAAIGRALSDPIPGIHPRERLPWIDHGR